MSVRDEFPKGHALYRNKGKVTEVFYVDREKVSILPQATAVLPERVARNYPKVLEKVVVTEGAAEA